MKNRRISLALAALLIVAGVCAVGSGAWGRSARAAEASAAEPQLVIIDTDIGDDIDDAFAVALALRSPELKILGVITAFGNTELRARLVDRYLAAVGRSDIPVEAGVHTETDNVMTQAAYARQAPDRKHPDGVAFLLDEIRQHPGQITLIAIGPLFNEQAAIERDPTTLRQLKRVVMMGGSINRGYDTGLNTVLPSALRSPDAEWNISRDPAGAKALFATGVPIFMMPLDSTQIHLQIPDQGEIYSHGSPLTDQLTLLYHEWTGAKQWRLPTLFDPVAVTYAFRPDLCPVKPFGIEVDDRGFTRPVAGTPNAEVCLQSDEKGFLALLLSRIAEK